MCINMQNYNDVIGLPYDHSHPSGIGSRQFAYKNFGCYGNGQ